MWNRIRKEIQIVQERDPAAHSAIEVLLCYPGLHAVLGYRITHWMWRHECKLLARILSQLIRWFTGVEIHPAARIGKGLFIDHGMGVVIGETASIGDNVTLYHDVTLGGTSLQEGIRHPQVGDAVIIGAGARLLGPIHVGSGARIGANAVVVSDVPEGATMVGVPAHPLKKDKKSAEFEAYGTPAGEEADPVIRRMEALAAEIEVLKKRMGE